MNTKIRNSQEKALDKFIKYFALTLAANCILCGIFLMAVGHEVLVISKIHALALSIVFTGYGFYKVIRMHEKYYPHSIHQKDYDYLNL